MRACVRGRRVVLLTTHLSVARRPLAWAKDGGNWMCFLRQTLSWVSSTIRKRIFGRCSGTGDGSTPRISLLDRYRVTFTTNRLGQTVSSSEDQSERLMRTIVLFESISTRKRRRWRPGIRASWHELSGFFSGSLKSDRWRVRKGWTHIGANRSHHTGDRCFGRRTSLEESVLRW